MTSPVNATGIEQADYLKLFMQELTYQDPLKPLDNKEFMAQMAQFSSLQESRTTNEHLTQLLGMTASTQSLNLLGKKVRINNTDGEGRVSTIEFSANEPPKLRVIMNNGEIPKVDLGQIIEVKD